MDNKILSRAFTTREKVLFLILAILLIGCVYLLAVWQPSMDAQSRAQSQISTVEDEIAIQQVIAAQRAQMKEEIAAAEKNGVTTKMLPQADNTKYLITELNSVLASAGSFDIEFEGATEESGIVRRTVKVSFTSGSFSEAEATLTSLLNCHYSCMITDFAISKSTSTIPGSQGGATSTTAVVIFFETT